MNGDLFDVTGKVCLVTGASSGLGAIIAEVLAEAGGRVVLVVRRFDRLRQVSETIGAGGREAQPIVCDVTNEANVREVVETISEKYVSLDVLVNNAGSTHTSRTVSLTAEDWRKVVEVNLTGSFLCAKHASTAMMRQRSGKIVNISSVYGLIADTSLELPYYAAKSGVLGLTRQLALEFAPYNLQVNSIAPGFFPSEMTKSVVEDIDLLSSTMSRIPMKRMGKSEDLKGVVRFLASRASDYITGQLIVVDGGWTLW
jgi:NAD(P)-dependent dehydrogenase (short-subunit alcohol dehydrogenase family)